MADPWPIALVSGASGGIGAAIVRRLLQEGYCVGLLGRDPARVLALGARLDPESLRTLPLAADVTVQASVQAAITMVRETWGRLDLLVCAHGAAPVIKSTLEVTMTDWWDVVTPDLWGSLALCQAAARLMLPQGGGCQVLISSIHAVGSYPRRALYAMAKAGVVGLVRALAVEWAVAGLRVNAVCPGQVDGPRTRAIAARDPTMLDKMRARSPAGRLVAAADVAETVLWLAHTPSLTGQAIMVDHGVTASLWFEPFEVRDHG